MLKSSVWASPNSLTSGTLGINKNVALDLTTCGFHYFIKNIKKVLTRSNEDDRMIELSFRESVNCLKKSFKK